MPAMPISVISTSKPDNPPASSDPADEKLRATYPADSRRSSSDSSNLGSSSTIATTDLCLLMLAPSRSARVSDRYFQSLRDTHEIGERCRSHFLHDVPSMNLQRDLADPQFSGSLLVEKTAHHERQHLSFARRQVEVALPQNGVFSAL